MKVIVRLNLFVGNCNIGFVGDSVINAQDTVIG
jgi:hypothetical protein